jgi:hypothetical protein
MNFELYEGIIFAQKIIKVFFRRIALQALPFASSVIRDNGFTFTVEQP